MRGYLPYLLLFVLTGCASVPITHRKQVSLVSEYEMIQNSNDAYQDFIATNSVVSPYHPDAILVRRVGERLQKGCHDFLLDYGDVERLAGFDWEFTLVEGEQKNAWCMPGGKVVVYTGILDVTEDEDGLAVVLSHEIAHAVARHGSERVSHQLITQYGGDALATILGTTMQTNEIDLSGLIMSTFDMGSQLGLLKFSRNHESEADKMGLVFMEYAGYDSYTAIEFWKRMSANSEGGVPQFMSTHPADHERIQAIEAFVPVAKSYEK